jgi:aldehyde dehydrogenase (NAD(P)+)
VLRSDLHAERERGLLQSELFAPVLLELPLAAVDAANWFDAATAFVRDHVFGALSAYVFAPTRLSARVRSRVDAAIDALPHGCVAINTWTGLGYGFGLTPWGVPQHRRPEHGVGRSRDLTGLDVERVVFEAPLRPLWRPPWLPAHRRAAATLRALTHYYLRPSLLRLCRTAAHALRP